MNEVGEKPHPLDSVLSAVVALIHAYDTDQHIGPFLARLSSVYHEAIGERPCDRCDQWTSCDSCLCKKCETETVGAA